MTQVLRFLLSPVLVIHVLLLLSTAYVYSMAASSPLPAPHCPSNCGRIEIPYPFGIGAECAWPGGGQFRVACNHSFHPPRLYTGNIEITSISVETGEMHVYAIVGSVCYNSSSTTDFNKGFVDWTLVPPFVISPTENVFTAIGCDALALLQGGSNWEYFTGCITSCVSIEESAPDGDPCTGLGCCRNSIPGNLSKIEVGWYTNNNSAVNNSAWEYSPCKHAFVAEKDWYNFSRQDLIGKGNNSYGNRVGDRSAPLVLDWAIRGNGSCKMVPDTGGVSVKLTAPACVSANSYCQDLNATQGGGYLCKCTKGYMGNPYIINGCTNINECEEYEHEELCGGGATCQDTVGDYKCKCKFGLRGDGRSNEGCQPIFPAYAIAIVATFSVLLVACFLIMEVKRRKQKNFFEKNGGEILKSMGLNIFTEKQLKKITNGYKRSIGEGAFGKVYKGIITDDSTQHVAVKCASVKGETLPQEEFVNEITFQFRIIHANIVRLIGCCLETDVPMLVFQFIPKGSLYDLLHADKDPNVLSLQERLDIAIGSAEGLSYMHSHGGHNHVHGDIKSGNILLDDNFTPKVSDFGSAKLVCVASMYSKWCVSGDMSYIDPMYIKSGRFTEKSDVYSFGVVLLELITRKKAKDGENSLPVDFVKCCKEERNGRKLYDKDMLSNDAAQAHHHMECLDRVGAFAVRCLMEDVDDRPTMVEVLEELKQVKAIASVGSGLLGS